MTFFDQAAPFSAEGWYVGNEVVVTQVAWDDDDFLRRAAVAHCHGMATRGDGAHKGGAGEGEPEEEPHAPEAREPIADRGVADQVAATNGGDKGPPVARQRSHRAEGVDG